MSPFLFPAPGSVEGVALNSLTGTASPPKWLDELHPSQDPPESRWWVANNAWSSNLSPQGPTFTIDADTYGRIGWNTKNLGTYDDRSFSPAVVNPTTYHPTTAGLNFCQRLIYGGLETAAWDYEGNLRPSSGVTAGAVQVEELGG